MTGDLSAKPLQLEMRVPNVIRMMLILVGAFIISVVLWEFGPALWPLNIATPFFLFMVLAAMTVGKPTILAGLFGYSYVWTIERDQLTIDLYNWFRRERHVFRQADIDGFDIVEVNAMEGENSWKVVLRVRGGKTFEVHDKSSRAAAERQRDEIIGALRGDPVSE